MQYADNMENSGKSLQEILKLSTADLAAEFEMKRGHIARFINKTRRNDSFKLPPIPARRRTSMMYRDDSIRNSHGSNSSGSSVRSHVRSNAGSDRTSSLEQSMVDLRIKDGHVFKGIVASEPAEPRACGCVKPPPVIDQVAAYSAVENISVQKLTPEYKIGMEPLVKIKAPPLKASELWLDKPAVFLCLRRPG